MPSGEESIRGLSITYTAVTRHHSGVYICDADNGFGDISSATLKLDVQRKLIIFNVLSLLDDKNIISNKSILRLSVDDMNRYDWVTPIMISKQSSKRVYLGGNRLFISNDSGVSWSKTKDLTKKTNRESLILNYFFTTN